MENKHNYPFTAIVGQESMKKALILNVINPRLGGVLIKGEKGTAKSTTVRALAELMTKIEVVEDCEYNCNPNDYCTMCDECRQKYELGNLKSSETNMKVINLPVSATEDRVVGSIDIEKAISTGKKFFEEGILAKANRNILYVDEVNLLDDNIVDILLDCAAMGVNIVEREGISIKHPSNFILVGTMNPEEGDLRPQLLDRFSLCVNIEGIKDVNQRVEIIQRRMEFEQDSVNFIEKFKNDQLDLYNKIKKAKKILNEVKVTVENLELVASLSIGFGVDGHRSDIAMIKTAKTIAAYNQRTFISEDDIKEAANLVFSHRLRRNPLDESNLEKDSIDDIINDFNNKKEENSNIHEKKNIVS